MKYLYCSVFVALLFSNPAIGGLEPMTTEGRSISEEPFKIEHAGRCISCHRAEQRIIGPSYREISRAYNDTSHYNPKEEAQRLMMKLRSGGAMPPKVKMLHGLPGFSHPATPSSVSDDDLKILVDWIMGLAKNH